MPMSEQERLSEADGPFASVFGMGQGQGQEGQGQSNLEALFGGLQPGGGGGGIGGVGGGMNMNNPGFPAAGNPVNDNAQPQLGGYNAFLNMFGAGGQGGQQQEGDQPPVGGYNAFANRFGLGRQGGQEQGDGGQPQVGGYNVLANMFGAGGQGGQQQGYGGQPQVGVLANMFGAGGQGGQQQGDGGQPQVAVPNALLNMFGAGRQNGQQQGDGGHPQVGVPNVLANMFGAGGQGGQQQGDGGQPQVAVPNALLNMFGEGRQNGQQGDGGQPQVAVPNALLNMFGAGRQNGQQQGDGGQPQVGGVPNAFANMFGAGGQGGQQQVGEGGGQPQQGVGQNGDFIQLFNGVQWKPNANAVPYVQTQEEKDAIREQLERNGIKIKSFEEMQEESERHRKEMVKKLKEVKKRWRKEEAEEIARQEALPDTDLTPLMKIVNVLRGGKACVRKRELPWWLDEMYDVPSNSEDEREMERREEERKRLGLPKYDMVPNTPEQFPNWQESVKNLSEDSVPEDPSDSSDEGCYLSDSSIDLKGLSLKDLWEGCMHIPESLGLKDVTKENLPQHIVALLEQLRGPRDPSLPTDDGDPIEMWKTLGVQKSKMYAERRKRRERREAKKANQAAGGKEKSKAKSIARGGNDDTDSDDDNNAIGGLGHESAPRPKKHKRSVKKKERNDDIAVNRMANLNLLPNNGTEVKQLNTNQPSGFVHECIDAGYEPDTSDDSDSDDGEGSQIGGLGLFH